ncbi:hypothetical protein QVA66_11265 [Staphylococcus chromogenes]|nr:hypothetical protein [Staphylococcus chromogenes]
MTYGHQPTEQFRQSASAAQILGQVPSSAAAPAKKKSRLWLVVALVLCITAIAAAVVWYFGLLERKEPEPAAPINPPAATSTPQPGKPREGASTSKVPHTGNFTGKTL